MSVPEIRWGDEEGNYWGIGHQNKTAFAAWAWRDAIENIGFSEMDEEVQELQAYRVFHAYYRNLDRYGEYMKITTTKRNAAHYPITGIWA